MLLYDSIYILDPKFPELFEKIQFYIPYILLKLFINKAEPLLPYV